MERDKVSSHLPVEAPKLSATMASNVPTTPDTLITIKVSFEGNYRKFKLPLRDLGASVLPSKLHNFLGIPPNVEVIYERYSDSAAYFVHLDPNDPAVYKQLYRAAKAKLKLRLRATIVKSSMEVPLSNGSTGTEQSAAKAVLGINPGQATVSENETPATYPQVDVASREEISSSVSKEASPTESQPAIPRPNVVEPAVPQPAVSQPAVSDTSVSSNFSSPRHNLAKVVGPVHGYSLSVGQLPGSSYAVYCNACDAPIGNAHYHCGICADGDFDLCCDCVEAGHLCDREEHWLIKRFIENGVVINSTTERLAPQKKAPAMESSKSSTVQKETVEDNAEVDDEEDITARTCNCCVEGKHKLLCVVASSAKMSA
jgi:next-to-BRCA1 protein 1